MPRLLATADIHFNHPRSTPLVDDLARRMLAAGGDILLLIGDTAITDADWLERALSLFSPFSGPRLFVAGNHELWLRGGDSYPLYHHELPRRVRAVGFQPLDQQPYITDSLAIVGSIGWYDYSFAPADLAIPRRFYEAKISPGAAARLGDWSHLIDDHEPLPQNILDVVARWNDSRYVRLGRSDERFLDELLTTLRAHLDAARTSRQCIAAIHHLPFAELLPPPHSPSWDFAKAFLGSPRIGQLLLQYPNVTTALCGHSHLAAEATVGHIRAINIGSGYRHKVFRQMDL